MKLYAGKKASFFKLENVLRLKMLSFKEFLVKI